MSISRTDKMYSDATANPKRQISTLSTLERRRVGVLGAELDTLHDPSTTNIHTSYPFRQLHVRICSSFDGEAGIFVGLGGGDGSPHLHDHSDAGAAPRGDGVRLARGRDAGEGGERERERCLARRRSSRSPFSRRSISAAA